MSAGRNTPDTLDRPMPRMAEAFARFMGLHKHLRIIVDIGAENWKVEDFKKYGCSVSNHVVPDLNVSTFRLPGSPVYTFFETLEHLQNPLHCMQQIALNMSERTVLFLSMPARPKWLWTEHHYHEIDPARLKKWILDPVGLHIIRMQKVRIVDTHPWWFWISGIRPLMRWFFNIYNHLRNHKAMIVTDGITYIALAEMPAMTLDQIRDAAHLVSTVTLQQLEEQYQ